MGALYTITVKSETDKCKITFGDTNNIVDNELIKPEKTAVVIIKHPRNYEPWNEDNYEGDIPENDDQIEAIKNEYIENNGCFPKLPLNNTAPSFKFNNKNISLFVYHEWVAKKFRNELRKIMVEKITELANIDFKEIKENQNKFF